MSDLTTIQQGYRENHSQTTAKNLELQKAKAAYDKLMADEEQELRGLNAQERERIKAVYEGDKKKKLQEIADIKTSIHDLKNRFDGIAGDFLNQLDPVAQLGKLDDAYPFLLFPLRLETRFKTVNAKRQLWLRVYPDDCNINTREDLLSESEVKNATAFWIEIWKAGGIEAEERGAWRSLVNSHGSGRSALIIQEFKPVNHKPSKPNANYRILVVTSALALSSTEQAAAQKYWAAYWLAKGNTTLIANAFNTLKADTNLATADQIVQNFVTPEPR